MAGSLVREEMKKMGKPAANMSALSVALMGHALASQEDGPAIQVDTEDEDWKTVVSTVKSGGPKSWFAKKVDFTFNDAHFLGRVGYSVQGGVVPLFDGAAIDLSVADLTAKDPKKAEPDPKMGNPAANQNWIVGRGGLLVLAPIGTESAIPVITDQVIVTEKGLVTEATKPMHFKKGEQEIEAQRIELSDTIAVLYGIQVKRDGADESERYRTEAVITGAGLTLVPDGEGYAPQNEQSAQEPEGIQVTPVNETMEAIADVVSDVTNLVSDEGRIEVGIAKEDADTEEGGFGAVFDAGKMNLVLGYRTKELAPEEEDPLWDQFLDTVKEKSSEQAKELLKAFMEGNGPEKTLEFFQKKWTALKSIYDGFSSQELKDSWAAFPSTVRSLFRNQLTEGDLTSYMEKLVPTGPIKDLIGIEEKEEETSLLSTEQNGTIPLAVIPIFPGFVDFSVNLVPGYQFSAFVTGGATNMRALWNLEEEQPANILLRAGVQGSLSLEANARLAAGVEVLLQGFAELYAKAALEGNIKPEDGALALNGTTDSVAIALDVNLPVKRMKDGSIDQAGDLSATLKGGLDLTGEVGARAGVESTLFLWKKTLWEKTFAKWNLLTIDMCLGLTKSPTPSLFSGWNLNEAAISVDSGFKDAFTKRNTAGRKYGLYEPKTVSSDNYKDIMENFQTVLRLLEDFAAASEGGDTAFAISTRGDDGLPATIDQMGQQLEQINNSMVTVWVRAQNELEYLEGAIQERGQSSYVKRQRNSAEESRARHESRLSYLGQWNEETHGNLLDYYDLHASNPGSGFREAMYAKAKDDLRTYEEIVRYERSRYDEKTRHHFERIQVLEQMKAQQKPEEEIKEAYYNEMGASRVKGQHAALQNTRTLLDYEYARMLEKTKAARESRTDVLKLSAQKGDRLAFLKAYADDYMGSRRLTDAEVFSFGDSDILLNYEKQKFYEDVKAKEGDLAMLNAAEAGRELAKQDPEADGGRLTNQFRSALKGQDKRVPDLAAKFGKELYRTATLDDLIAIRIEKTQGEAGKRLGEYRSGNPQAASGSASGQLEEIFGGKIKKHQAMERFRGWLDKRETPELVSALTIEILLDYARLRQGKSSNPEMEASEIRYLTRGQTAMAAAPAGEARAVEEEYIEGYFKLYSKTEELYRKALKGGRIMNLPLMDMAFSDASEDPVYGALEELKEAGAPDYKALLTYLSLVENENDAKEEINEHQKRKAEASPLDYQDVHRFYESRVAEASDGRKKQGGHYERYERLRDMHQKGGSYEQLLAEYAALGAGRGYRGYLVDSLKTGRIGEKDISIEMVLEVEDRRVKRFGEKHIERLDMINQMSDEGKGYDEIFDQYQATVTSQGGQIKKVLHRKSRYERQMNKQEINADQLISYERFRAEEAGRKHAARLRSLLDLPEDSDTFMTEPLRLPPEEREAKRKDYLEKAKRFKKSDLPADPDKDRFMEELRSRPAEELKKSLLEYETGRRNHYDEKLAELERSQAEIERMRNDLKAMVAECHAMSSALINIRTQPSMIQTELGRFKEAAAYLEAHKDPKAEKEKLDAMRGRAFDRADAAMKAMNEMEAAETRSGT